MRKPLKMQKNLQGIDRESFQGKEQLLPSLTPVPSVASYRYLRNKYWSSTYHVPGSGATSVSKMDINPFVCGVYIPRGAEGGARSQGQMKWWCEIKIRQMGRGAMKINDSRGRAEERAAERGRGMHCTWGGCVIRTLKCWHYFLARRDPSISLGTLNLLFGL